MLTISWTFKPAPVSALVIGPSVSGVLRLAHTIRCAVVRGAMISGKFTEFFT